MVKVSYLRAGHAGCREHATHLRTLCYIMIAVKRRFINLGNLAINARTVHSVALRSSLASSAYKGIMRKSCKLSSAVVVRRRSDRKRSNLGTRKKLPPSPWLEGGLGKGWGRVWGVVALVWRGAAALPGH